MDDPTLRWYRRGAALGLLVLAGLPLLAPFLDLLFLPHAWAALLETDRLLKLASTTTLLLAGTIALAVPLGAVLGLLLFRTDLPGAGAWRLLLLAALFLPLPLVASGWQMAGQFFHLSGWLDGSLLFGMGLHAVTALPWVMLLTGLGFTWVEAELEEEALLAAPPWRAFWHVTLPRSRAALGMAALLVALFCWSEITLTDLLRLPTYGEEVYLQLVASNETEVARAVAVSLPPLLILLPVTMFTLSRWQRSCPPRLHIIREARIFPLGKGRWLATVFVSGMVFLVLGVPLFGLIWKAGLRYATAAQPGPPSWEAGLVMQRFADQCGTQAGLLRDSLLLSGITGVLAAMGALVLAWFMRHSVRWERGLWSLAAALWVVPGPLLGLGLLTYWQWLFALPGGDWLKPFLWSRPSPVPNVWVCLLRFGPVALAVLWPLVRQVPRDLEEAAALDGARPWQRFRLVFLPALARPAMWAALIVATLTLGEISASKLITTPGFTPLAHHVFQQMHAGADTELAALCLVLLAGVAVGGMLVMACRPRPAGNSS
jgi:iron(III) transport system permease protein